METETLFSDSSNACSTGFENGSVLSQNRKSLRSYLPTTRLFLGWNQTRPGLLKAGASSTVTAGETCSLPSSTSPGCAKTSDVIDPQIQALLPILIGKTACPLSRWTQLRMRVQWEMRWLPVNTYLWSRGLADDGSNRRIRQVAIAWFAALNVVVPSSVIWKGTPVTGMHATTPHEKLRG